MASENYEEQSITVVPINGPATDVLNLNFDKLPPHQVRGLREAWMTHGILQFRGYEISKEQHLAITKLFGDFVERDAQENGSAAAYKKPEEILVMSHTQAAPSGTKSNAELRWHSDIWFFEYPPVNEILHAIEVLKAGGDTYCVDMYAVYESLPPATRKIIDGRLIQFDTVYNRHGNLLKGQEAPKTDDFRLWLHTRHLIVRTHPESGRMRSSLATAISSGTGLLACQSNKAMLSWRRYTAMSCDLSFNCIRFGGLET
jgi:taurine dioxygenase